MTVFAELDLVARTDDLKKAQDEIRKIGSEGEKAEEKIKRSTTAMRDEFGRFVKRGHEATDAVTGFGVTTDRVTRSASLGFARLASAAGVVAGSIVSMQTATAAIASARQFDAALAETSTLLAGNADQMKIVEAGARSLAREFGGNATSQVQAYYQAISAGAGDAAAATKLLDSANRLAKGGVTDVTTAVDVLTTATNAYKASGLSAAEASDALFVGMKAGKTTITELSAAVGGVLPLAVSLGVSFDETVAAMSALTTQGIGTAQAATGVRAALTSMIAPSDEAAKLAAKLGIEFSAAGVQANGFGGVMDQIVAKTGGNTAQIQMLFGSVEATTAALSFAGGAGTVYGTIMDQMAEKAGATSEAFDIVAASLNERLNVVLAQGSDLLLGLGQVLLSVIVPALEIGVSLFDAASGSMEVFAIIATGLAFTQIPALIVALGAKAAALIAVASAAGIASAAGTVLGAVFAALGGPIGIVIGAIGALGAAMFVTRDRAVNLGGASDEMNRALQNVPGMADGAAGGLGRAGTVAYDAAGKFDDFTGAVGASRTALQLWYDDYMAATQLPPINGPLGVTINPPGTPDSFAEIENFLNPGSGDTASPLAPGRTPRPRAAPNNIDAGYNPASGGGRGGGGVASDGFQDRLDALIQQFEAEQAVVDAWYEEAQAVLADRRAMEILGAEEHAALLQSVEDEHQRQMAEIRMAAWDSQMGEYGSFLGAMAELTAQGGEKMAKISRGFAAAEAFVNTLRAQAQVLADPKLGFFGKLAAYAKIGAAGMGIVNALKGGGSGGGGSVSAESSRAPTAQPEQTQSRFLQIEVNGEGMFAEALRDNVQSIADAISDLSGRGGTTIVVGR